MLESREEIPPKNLQDILDMEDIAVVIVTLCVFPQRGVTFCKSMVSLTSAILVLEVVILGYRRGTLRVSAS
jgi:hypothetical protein